MSDFVNSDWQEILQHNELDSFEALWALEIGWFEEPNKRRGGWSGVSYLKLKKPDGGEVACFLKRQQNHRSKTTFHPLKGVLTFCREFEKIQLFQTNRISSLTPVFFGQRDTDGNDRAVLLTVALDQFSSLDSDPYQKGSPLMASFESRKQLFRSVAELVRDMHEQRFHHNCLYPKHIFVQKGEGDTFEARVIDLEKVKRPLFKTLAVTRDLDSLNRHWPGWSITDRMRFFKLYRNEHKLSSGSKKIWRSVAALARKKGKHQNS